MFEEQFKNIPTEPPRPLELLPGLKLGAQVPKSILSLILMFAIFFTFIPLSIMFEDPHARLSLGPSKTTSAQVVSVSDTRDCRRLVYAFTPEQGGEVRGVASVYPDSPYWSVGQGSTVPVKYLSSDPSTNALAGTRNTNAPPVFVFFFFPLIALAAISQLFLPQLQALRQARRLFKNGQLATGTVVYVRRRFTSMRTSTMSIGAADVFISFRLPTTGAQQEGKAWCMNDWLLQHLAPGTAVHIVYDPNSPDKLALLETFLR